MTHFLIAETRLRDRTWVPDYLAHVTRLIHQHGGEILSRTLAAEHLEGDGDAPHVVSVIAFPSREAALAFYDSPSYAPYREARRAGSRSVVRLVPGEDVAQQARPEP